MRNEFFTTLGALAKPSGLARLQERVALTPEEIDQLSTLVQSEIESFPDLRNTTIRIGDTGHGGGAFFPEANTVSIGNPADTSMFAHELGHAKSVGGAGPLYRSIQDTARAATKVTNKLKYTLPLAFLFPLMLQGSPAAKKLLGRRALDVLTGVTVAANAPVLFEEASAAVDALRHTPDTTAATKDLVKTLGSYTAAAAIPAVAYQLAKRMI